MTDQATRIVIAPTPEELEIINRERRIVGAMGVGADAGDVILDYFRLRVRIPWSADREKLDRLVDRLLDAMEAK